MLPTFTYYRDITSIYDCSLVGSTNKCLIILSTIYIFIPVRDGVGRGPNALLCPGGYAIKRGNYTGNHGNLNTYLSCHNFFFLSSVQILLIPACCLLCVL